MKTLIIVKIIISLLVVSCSNNNRLDNYTSTTILRGTYRVDSNLELRNIILQIELIKVPKLFNNLKLPKEFSKEESSYYTVPIKDSGHFEVKIKERGKYFVNIGISYVENFSKKEIKLSNEYSEIIIDFEEGKTHSLENLFVSPSVNIILPKYNNSYNKEKLVFEWEKIHFADYYDLYIEKANVPNYADDVISKVLKRYARKKDVDLKKLRGKLNDALNGVKDKVNNNIMIQIYNLKASKVSYKDLKKIGVIKEINGEVSFDMVRGKKPSKGNFKELIPGEYTLYIYAYRYLDKKKRVLKVSEYSISFFINK